MVTWLTPSDASSYVKYGLTDMDTVAEGTQQKFMDGGKEHRVMWIHRVTLKNLAPKTRYSKCEFY